MKIIRELFDQTRPIDRRIVAVINYAADDENLIRQEIAEYEITDSLSRHYERFMINLDAGFKGGGGHEVGVWVSGFYGSGKSSFTKYLGFALDPSRRVGSEPFLTCFQNQIPSAPLRTQLGTLARNFPATVIMIDLASVASAEEANQGISRVVYHKVLEWAGYSKDEKISLLELMVERDGRKDEFLAGIEETGYTWDELQNDLLAANAIVSRVACKLYPKLWPDEASFSRTKVDSFYGEDERLKQMLALIERRTGSRRVIFILDEVGQFIEGTNRLILNLQGFAENLKNIGQGQAWIIATAQQTLPMAGPLFKLKDRFPDPLRIDIESTDIREITYRRLLKKSPEAIQLLKKLFGDHSGSITAATQLKNTKHIQTHLDADEFARLYPFLPQHFNILMELLRSLARSTGGIGLRSTLKVIQDVLVDMKGQQSGIHLADQSIGTLATADIFFDTLRPDIERANRPLVEAVAKVANAYGADSLHHRIAKTVAVLQLVEGFPVSSHNVAAMLHPASAATPLFESVDKAANEMCDDKELPIEVVDGSLRFMSEAVSQILIDQGSLRPSSNDELTILNEILRDQIFSPEPMARLANTKNVKAQVKLLHGTMPVAVTHSKEVSQFIIAQKTRAEQLKRDLDTIIQNSFLKGSFVFRGTNTAVATRGTELRQACNSQLTHVATDVFPAYKQAPQNLDANIAEKLLLAPDLSTVPSATDPLGLVDKAGAATKIRTDHPALVSLLDYLRTRGEVDGRKLLDDFNRAPYGWFKDTTRYLTAGLLISQAIRIKVGGQWLEAVGPKATEALKNNNTFAKIDVATNDKQIPQETLNRAAKRLLDLTGEKILPMAPRISQAVLKYFPAFRNEYSPLAVELTASSLPGSDRAQSLAKQLAQILDRDASDAPITLSAEESSIVESLEWAREVRKALVNELGKDASEAASLATAIASLPKVGVLEQLATSTLVLRDELQECLTREDFYTVASDIRNRLTALREQVKAAATGLGLEIAAHLETQREAIMSMPEWSELPADDRSAFSHQLDGTTLPEATDIAGIRHLLNRRMELDANLTQLRTAVIDRHKKLKEEANRVPVSDIVEDKAKPTPIPLKIRVRRRYTPTDHAALEQTIGALTTGLTSLKSQAATEVTVELD
ncbi:MAG: BREX system P-loop protein BrxC [Verrucomicrobia bacterium]|nr:BREX system P-loop protein BrxC [Verrucomicrobiota bacterium]